MNIFVELGHLCKLRDDLNFLISRKIDDFIKSIPDDRKDNKIYWKNAINSFGEVTAVKIRRDKFGGSLKENYEFIKWVSNETEAMNERERRQILKHSDDDDGCS